MYFAQQNIMISVLRKTFTAQKPFRIIFQSRLFATRKYTPDHEWLSIEGDVGTFGITDYAQKGIMHLLI